MTVRHTLASLDDEQARDLLLQVARAEEDASSCTVAYSLPLLLQVARTGRVRYRPSRMLELMLDALMGAEADEACGAVYMTRGDVGGNRRNTDGDETTATSNRKNPRNRPLTQSRFASRS